MQGVRVACMIAQKRLCSSEAQVCITCRGAEVRARGAWGCMHRALEHESPLNKAMDACEMACAGMAGSLMDWLAREWEGGYDSSVGQQATLVLMHPIPVLLAPAEHPCCACAWPCSPTSLHRTQSPSSHLAAQAQHRRMGKSDKQLQHGASTQHDRGCSVTGAASTAHSISQC